MIQISLDELHGLIVQALVQSRTSPVNARAVARGLCAAEADGHPAHGASRAPFYADQARSGKVDGMATPLVDRPAPAVVRVDARNGFAYPAVAAGIERVRELVGTAGMAAVSVANSHHLGMVGYHIEPLADAASWPWRSEPRRASRRGAAPRRCSGPIPSPWPPRASTILRS